VYFTDVGAMVIDEDERVNADVGLFHFAQEKFEVKKGNRIAEPNCNIFLSRNWMTLKGVEEVLVPLERIKIWAKNRK
jgi:dUTPase